MEEDDVDVDGGDGVVSAVLYGVYETVPVLGLHARRVSSLQRQGKTESKYKLDK